MFCTHCGVELSAEDRFCSGCGVRTGVGEPPPAAKSLMLDKRNKKVAGVCAGLARYLDLDVILVRVIWLAFAIGTGMGFVAYLAAWIIMPSDYGVAPQLSPAPHPQAV